MQFAGCLKSLLLPSRLRTMAKYHGCWSSMLTLECFESVPWSGIVDCSIVQSSERRGLLILSSFSCYKPLSRAWTDPNITGSIEMSNVFACMVSFQSDVHRIQTSIYRNLLSNRTSLFRFCTFQWKLRPARIHVNWNDFVLSFTKSDLVRDVYIPMVHSYGFTCFSCALLIFAILQIFALQRYSYSSHTSEGDTASVRSVQHMKSPTIWRMPRCIYLFSLSILIIVNNRTHLMRVCYEREFNLKNSMHALKSCLRCAGVGVPENETRADLIERYLDIMHSWRYRHQALQAWRSAEA